MTSNEINPSASVKSFLTAANWPNAESAVVIVGHEPTLSEIADYFIPVIPSGLSVKKGSVCWIGAIKQRSRYCVPSFIPRCCELTGFDLDDV